MIKSLVFLLILSTLCLSQSGQFWYFNTSRFSRSIGLGNAYTGVAEGIETTFYNSAGISDIEELILAYSNGDGKAIDSEFTSHDVGFVLPLQRFKGSVAFTYSDIRLENPLWNQMLYRLHFGSVVLPSFSVGGSINYYHMDLLEEYNANAWDFSLSFLYHTSGLDREKLDDLIKIGFQLQNVLGTNVKNNQNLSSEPLFQLFRAGISYSLSPFLNYFNNIRLMLAGDIVSEGVDYSFESLRGNLGIEVELYRYFYFRYGRENQIKSSDYDFSTGSVNRFGLGSKIPLHRFFNLKYFDILLDYSYSHWPEIDEEYLNSIQERYYTYSIQIRAKL
jgi:hypothetical protein